MQLLKSKKSLTIIIVILLISNSITYFYIAKKKDAEWQGKEQEQSLISYKIRRSSDYKYVRPILLVDEESESQNLNGLKQNISDIINNYQKIGVLNSASFYIKEFNGNSWTGVNVEEKFLPGSLMKVPEMIAFLKMNEQKPGTLDRVITYKHADELGRHTNFNSRTIQPGKSYTIRELLNYMIRYSDNQATDLLNRQVDVNIFGKVFTDLGLKTPDWKASSYPITAKEYSVFMRALYNGAYLNIENSEIGAKLLSECDFKLGLLSGLPKGMKVAHKFGESGDSRGQQLSEAAIVYLDGNPYVIVVMTSGKDHKLLPGVIKEISSATFQYMNSNPISVD